MSDTTHSIFHSAKRFLSGTVISRFSGLARDIVMAFAFGTTGDVAAFLMAFRFSHLLRRLFGEGALQTAFIPQFEQLKSQDVARSALFFKDLTSVLSIALFIVAASVMVFLEGILSISLLNATSKEIIYLTLLMMPSLPFICLYGLNSAFLQCNKSYFIPSVAPVAFNITWIVFTLVIWRLSLANPMKWLAFGVTAACFAQWLMTLPKTLSFFKPFKISDLFKVNFFSDDLKLLIKPLSLGFVGIAASQVNSALDSIFARYASDSGPALLWYSVRIEQLPLALFGIALSGALLPPLTRAIKNKDLVSYRLFLKFALRKSMAFMIPMSAALIIFGSSCINFIYGRGDFNDQSIIGTSQCLMGYAFGLLPMSFVLILAPACYAQGNYHAPAKGSFFSMILNVVLNGAFALVFGLGPAFIALATSISSFFNAFYLAKSLQASGVFFDFSPLKSNGFSVLKASLAASAAVATVGHFCFNQSFFFSIFSSQEVAFPKSLNAQCLRLFIEALTFGSVLLGAAKLLKADDILSLAKHEQAAESA